MATSVSNVVCQTRDGSTASLTKWHGKWQWVVHRGPELPSLSEGGVEKRKQRTGEDLAQHHKVSALI
jgi:hypothetical protein